MSLGILTDEYGPPPADLAALLRLNAASTTKQPSPNMPGVSPNPAF